MNKTYDDVRLDWERVWLRPSIGYATVGELGVVVPLVGVTRRSRRWLTAEHELSPPGWTSEPTWPVKIEHWSGSDGAPKLGVVVSPGTSAALVRDVLGEFIAAVNQLATRKRTAEELVESESDAARKLARRRSEYRAAAFAAMEPELIALERDLSSAAATAA